MGTGGMAAPAGWYVCRVEARTDAGTAWKLRWFLHMTVPGQSLVQAAISAPVSGATVRGLVAVQGSATATPFDYYALDFGSAETPMVFSRILGSGTPVSRGELGRWETADLPSGPYALRLTVGNTAGTKSEVTSTVFVDSAVSGILVAASAVPGAFKREQGRTTLRYRLRRDATVRVVVLDDTGKSVWTSDAALPVGPGQSAGWHELTWDGRTEGGLYVASGRYTAVFVAGDQAERERKVVHLNVLESDAGLGGGSYGIAGRPGGSAGGNSGKGGGTSGAGGSGGSSAAAGAGAAVSTGSPAASTADPASNGTPHDNGWHEGNNPNGFTIDHPDKSQGNGNNHH
jgi:hypothetical protein